MARILVADDEEQVRLYVALLAESMGHSVDAVCDGRGAIEKARQERFDLVITDIMMPQGDGLEVVMTIRREMPHVKLLAISGYGLEDQPLQLEYLTAASKLGNATTLRKPFTPAEFEKAVRRLIG